MVHNKLTKPSKLICAAALIIVVGAAPACNANEVSKVDDVTAAHSPEGVSKVDAARQLVNKAVVLQSAGRQLQAIAYFEKAKALDSNNWHASLGLAKSLMLLDRRLESIAILHNMYAQSGTNFEREYQLGQAFLFYNQPALAVETASRAMQLARTSDEKSRSLQQLFLSCIRDNQEQRARDLQRQVLEECKPTDEQVYIRAATIASPLTPETSMELLKAAMLNLNKPENSGTFFRLAQIFDKKTEFVQYDRTKYSAWLRNSDAAYKQAFNVDPSPSLYRLALANNAAKQGHESELITELLAAHESNMQDQLPGYLLSKLKPMEVATTNLSGALPQAAVNLTQVKLAIEGLHCSCKRSMIINSFKQTRGIILTTISPKFPFVGTVLVDESMISTNDMLSKIANKPLPEFNYKLISTKPIKSAQEALQVDVDGRKFEYPAVIDAWPEFKPST
ncbi:MAG: hypothetical protein JST89_23920 [Cyanobacteria bacterium SZAS-4]|nr:hypothetical protein [Cyanobacteria bacterium SZAS-4]